jgi:hypothetical protein
VPDLDGPTAVVTALPVTGEVGDGFTGDGPRFVGMRSKASEQSPLITVFAVCVAGVAVLGTQFLGWEWGGGFLVPTLVGVVAAGLAVVYHLR